ncbi:MAG TPA: hypothetical protein VKR31_03140 [Rhizomicrobium sp.]|nr:hypothetical protein [Rhizomicrobium sp.]
MLCRCIGLVLGVSAPVSLVEDAGAREKTIYSFDNSGTDGWTPVAGLVSVNGTLFGTTPYGGNYDNGACDLGCGTVFSLDRHTGQMTVLHALPPAAATE